MLSRWNRRALGRSGLQPFYLLHGFLPSKGSLFELKETLEFLTYGRKLKIKRGMGCLKTPTNSKKREMKLD